MCFRSFFLLTAVGGLLAAAPAFAQGQQQTPYDQALAQKLTQEVNENLACGTRAIVLQQQVQKLQAELAKLQKPEKKSEPAKKKP